MSTFRQPTVFRNKRQPKPKNNAVHMTLYCTQTHHLNPGTPYLVIGDHRETASPAVLPGRLPVASISDNLCWPPPVSLKILAFTPPHLSDRLA